VSKKVLEHWHLARERERGRERERKGERERKIMIVHALINLMSTHIFFSACIILEIMAAFTLAFTTAKNGSNCDCDFGQQ
jgi:hypothetical protein